MDHLLSKSQWLPYIKKFMNQTCFLRLMKIPNIWVMDIAEEFHVKVIEYILNKITRRRCPCKDKTLSEPQVDKTKK